MSKTDTIITLFKRITLVFLRNVFFNQEPIPAPPSLSPRSQKVEANEIKEWEKQNKPVPPPYAYKRMVIVKTAKKNKIKTFIETGTYLGQTPIQLQHDFDQLHTIELDKRLYNQAKKLLRPIKHIHVWKGDSAKVLKKILPNLNNPILFWLDAHFSGGFTARGFFSDTPIEQELKTILARNKKDIILIDDAREFGEKPFYPSIDSIKKLVSKHRKIKTFTVENDIISIELD